MKSCLPSRLQNSLKLKGATYLTQVRSKAVICVLKPCYSFWQGEWFLCCFSQFLKHWWDFYSFFFYEKVKGKVLSPKYVHTSISAFSLGVTWEYCMSFSLVSSRKKFFERLLSLDLYWNRAVLETSYIINSYGWALMYVNTPVDFPQTRYVRIAQVCHRT